MPKFQSTHCSPMDTKWCFGVFWSILLTFDTWKLQNLWLTQNALLRGTKVVKQLFLFSGPKMIYGRISEHFTKLRHVKRWKTCVFGLNALFRGTEVVKHTIYSIGAKMLFGIVLLHFANLLQVKRCETCVQACMHYFEIPKLWILRSTPLDRKLCLGVFRSILLTLGT
jgi:hypothetical protein